MGHKINACATAENSGREMKRILCDNIETHTHTHSYLFRRTTREIIVRLRGELGQIKFLKYFLLKIYFVFKLNNNKIKF